MRSWRSSTTRPRRSVARSTTARMPGDATCLAWTRHADVPGLRARPGVPARLCRVLRRAAAVRARHGPPPPRLRGGAPLEPAAAHPGALRRTRGVRVRPDEDVQGRPRGADARRDLLGLRAA